MVQKPCNQPVLLRPGIRKVVFVAFLASIALSCGSARTDTLTFALATQDGFKLVFDMQNKKFSSLAIPGYNVDISQKAELGVYLYDPSGGILLDANIDPVASYQTTNNTVTLTRKNFGNAIQTRETWKAYAKHIELETTITNTRIPLDSRAIEACVQLPLDLIGRQWHHHLDQMETIQQRTEPYKTVLTKLLDIGSFGDGSFHIKSDLDFNLNGLNLVGNANFGIAIALHPEKPAAYYVKYDSIRKSYDACFHLGMYSGHITNKNTVTLSVAFFFPDNPEWGLRSAFAKYTAIYPQSFTGSLGRKSGMVVLETYNYKAFPDPREFHVESTWGTYKARNRDYRVYSLVYVWPTGFIDRGMRLKATSGASGVDRSSEADITSCLQVYADYEQNRHPFEEICSGTLPFSGCRKANQNGRVYGPVYQDQSKGWYNLQAFQVTVSNSPNFLFGKFTIREPFYTSLLQDTSGRHVNAMSYASALEEVFWEPGYKRCIFDGINPDPGLEVIPSRQLGPGPAPTLTRNFGHLNLEIAKRANGLYGAGYLDTDPVEGTTLFTGVAVDTVGVYLRPDFNPRMLRTASLPLGYDRASSKVVAFEHLSLQAFLKALRAALPLTAPITVSGKPISGILGQEADYLVNETGKIERNGTIVDDIYDERFQNKLRAVNRMRMAANQRSITFTVRFDRATNEQQLIDQIKQYLPLYTSKGIYINIDQYGQNLEKYFWSERPKNPAVLQAYKKHLDAVFALNSAGWEPATFAQVTDQAGRTNADVLVERFGNKYFTLYNSAGQSTTVGLTINWKKIGRSSPPANIVDWETATTLPFTVSGDFLTIAGLNLTSNRVQMVDLRDTPRAYLPLTRQ